MKTRRQFGHAVVLACLSLFALSAWSLDAPQERVVLTVTGKIAEKNAPDSARFDMKMIEALPQHTFTTRTPWYDQPVTFTGPLLSDVLAAVKASGTTLSATAINDYRISIPLADAAQHGVIMARLLNGKPMPVREKGPLFIVYPFDSKAELRTSVYYERSIWQLKALDVQ